MSRTRRFPDFHLLNGSQKRTSSQDFLSLNRKEADVNSTLLQDLSLDENMTTPPSQPPAPPASPLSTNIDSAFLKLNISGRSYAISELTIRRKLKNTLFALLHYRDNNNSNFNGQEYILPHCILLANNEYYLERSPIIFELILHYAYTGKLHCPVGICDSMLLEEMRFWRLPEKVLEDCCTPMVTGDNMIAQGLEDTLANDKPSEIVQNGYGPPAPLNRMVSSHQLTRRDGVVNANVTGKKVLDFIWRLFDDPNSSWAAYILNIICVLFILLSITSLVMSTIPSLQQCTGHEFLGVDDDSSNSDDTVINNSNSSRNHTMTSTMTTPFDPLLNSTEFNATTPAIFFFKKTIKQKFSRSCEGGFIFNIIESICIAWFTLEWIIRFVSCPNKSVFLKSVLNIIDILATLPYYVELFIAISDVDPGTGGTALLQFIRVMRVLRVFRIIRLARYFDSLQLMGETLWGSRSELGLLLLFLSVSTVIFSTILFYIEKDEPESKYVSIPASFWWCVVTLTTTGYGDMTPVTPLGKVAAGCACIVGVLILAFPVSILVEKFRSRYENKNKVRLTKIVSNLSMQAIKLAQEKVSQDNKV